MNLSQSVPIALLLIGAIGAIYHSYGCADSTLRPGEVQSDVFEIESEPVQRHLEINLDKVGNNGKPKGKFPLTECQGDCDKDGDCDGKFVCFKRKRGDSRPVPGCSGNPQGGTDYCVNPSKLGGVGGDGDEGIEDGKLKGGSFRLKLFWKKGYMWQGEKRERKWCMECVGGSCGNGDKIELQKCDGGNTKFEFVPKGGGDVMVRAKNKNLCMTLQGRRDIRMRRCSSGDRKQIWRTDGRGSFSGSRFEIHPASVDGCITQHHHPKAGEEIYVDKRCYRARKHDTSYWNRH